MPSEQRGGHFTENTGRPSKELYSMAGMMSVAEFKRLRVRGNEAVNMAIYLEGAGWNILAAAKILARRVRGAAQAADWPLSAAVALIRRFWSAADALPPSGATAPKLVQIRISLTSVQ